MSFKFNCNNCCQIEIYQRLDYDTYIYESYFIKNKLSPSVLPAVLQSPLVKPRSEVKCSLCYSLSLAICQCNSRQNRFSRSRDYPEEIDRQTTKNYKDCFFDVSELTLKFSQMKYFCCSCKN